MSCALGVGIFGFREGRSADALFVSSFVFEYAAVTISVRLTLELLRVMKAGFGTANLAPPFAARPSFALPLGGEAASETSGGLIPGVTGEMGRSIALLDPKGVLRPESGAEKALSPFRESSAPLQYQSSQTSLHPLPPIPQSVLGATFPPMPGVPGIRGVCGISSSRPADTGGTQ